MRNVLVNVIGLMVLVIFSACAAKGPRYESFNGILWIQTALEHNMICQQIYEIARDRLDKGLQDTSWTAALEQGEDFERLPAAIITDADETVLNNSPFEARLLEKGIGFNEELWNQWARAAKAKAIPGAREFIQYAKDKGVEVFYVTNRKAIIEESTVKNIKSESWC